METNGEEKRGAFKLEISEDDDEVAYLRLPTHPGTDVCPMSKSVRLIDIIGPYKGPDVVLDFDKRGVLVGIEIF
jgi:hypothetical protein